MSGGVSSTRLVIINTVTSPTLVSKWCRECSSWIQSLDKQITARYNGIPNRWPILFNALKLVLPGDYCAAITNSQSDCGTLNITLKFNTTEKRRIVFIRSPAASHTFAKLLILTGMLSVDS